MQKGSAKNVLVQAAIIVFFSIIGGIVPGNILLAAPDLAPEWYPDLDLPNDTTMYLCGTEEVCFDVIGSDPDPTDTLVLTLVSGPIEFAPDTFFTNSFNTQVCFQAEATGVYEFIFRLKDKTGRNVWDTLVITTDVVFPPVLDDQSFAVDLCNTGEERTLDLSYDNPEGDWTFELLSGPGSINPSNGTITYSPVSSGVYLFEVAVSNRCHSDTATITDSVEVNSPPSVIVYDSTVYLCELEEICFDVVAVDPDGDSVTIEKVRGEGTFTQLTDSSGQSCFWPADVDSATYVFIYRAADSCAEAGDPDFFAAPPGYCWGDTITITVVLNHKPEFVCPDAQQFDLCEPDTICFAFDIIGADTSEVVINILSGNATLDGYTVCAVADSSVEFDIVIEAVGECGTDTCTVPVTVNMNRPPYVTTADDFDISLCQPEVVCFSAYADDLDFNIDQTSVNFGEYDSGTNRICFQADTAGLYTIILSTVDVCGETDSDTTLVTVDMNQPPQVELGDDFSAVVCEPGEYCFDVSIIDDNIQSVTGNLGMYHADLGQLCFSPDTAGAYLIWVQVTDDCGAAVFDTITVTVEFGTTPILDDQSFVDELCNLREPRNLPLVFDNPMGDWTFSLLVGPGSIDPITGVITYQPDTSGVFIFEVEVSSLCGSDTATVHDSLVLNLPPHCIGFDSTKFLCAVEEICFDVFAFDSEGDPITITMLEGLGSFTQVTDTSGFTCFTPADVDSATYTFIYHAADSCVLYNESLPDASPQICCIDTVTITVIIDNPPELVCPEEQIFTTCDPGTFCFDIDLIDRYPDDVVINILSGNAALDGKTVCITTDTSIQTNVVIEAVDSCGADTCTVPVTININQGPEVVTADDFDLFLCEPQEICFDALATDKDNNIVQVSANVGIYNADNNQVCFQADTSGVYVIVLTATDTCGVSASDTTIVTVELNESPIVVLGDDFSLDECEIDEVCVPVTITDGNLVTVTSNLGQYDSVLGQVCFVPDTSGIYVLTVEAVDECAAVDVDTITITVQLGSSPVIAGFENTTLYLCEPQEVCLTPVINDPDNDILSITVNQPYVYSNGQICFEAFSAGDYEVILTVVDSCGFTAVDTAIVTIKTDQDIVLECPLDTSVFLCTPDTLCFPIDVPENAQVDIQGTNVWWNTETRSVCFYSDCCLENTITVSVTTACGTYSCQFTVTVQTNTPPLVVLPEDTALAFCEPSTVCLPAGISDLDNNIETITVEGGWYDDFNNVVCFDFDTAGVYVVTVTATDSCGHEDSDEVAVTVGLLDFVEVVCGTGDTTAFLCGVPDTLSFPVTITGDPASIVVQPEGAFLSDGFIHVPVITPDPIEVAVRVEGPCNVDSCSFVLSIEINSPPDVSVGSDTTLMLCELGEVCVDFDLNDPDDNLVEVRTTFGLIIDSAICFTPESYGDYEIIVEATDSCGAIDADTINVSIVEGTFASIDCPVSPIKVALDLPDTLRIPITVTPIDAPITVSPFGFYDTDSGELVVFFEQQGTYDFELSVTAECNVAVCSLQVQVNQYITPLVLCQGTVDTALCLLDPETVCLPVTVEGTDVTIEVAPIGSYVDDSVCIPVDTAGEYRIRIIAANEREADTCYTTLVVSLGRLPVIELPEAAEFSLCEPSEVCIPMSIQGTDFGIDDLRISYGFYNSITEEICFDADSAGIYTIAVSVSDSCGNVAYDTSFVTIVEGTFASIDCPVSPIKVALDLPDTLRIPITVTPIDAPITVSPFGFYDTDAGELVVFFEQQGTYDFELSVTAECNVAVCSLQVQVNQYITPLVLCQGTVDTALCLLDPETVCLPATVEGTDVTVEVAPIGSYVDDSVCIPVDTAGEYRIRIIAANEREADTCYTTLVVTRGRLPVIELPEAAEFFLCEPSEVCIPMSIQGTDFGIDDLRISYGFYNSITEEICFDADSAGIYTIAVSVSDSCGNVAFDTALVTVDVNGIPIVQIEPLSKFICSGEQVCVPVTIIDDNLTGVTTNLGILDTLTGDVCFYPDTSGIYSLIIEATDTCGVITTATAEIEVQINRAPEISDLNDSTIYLCNPQSICLDPVVFDPDNNLVSVSVNRGTYENGQLCFVPFTMGEYELILTAIDECGLIAVDTAVITIVTDQSIALVCPSDTSIFLCQPDTLCFPIDGIPDNVQVDVGGTNVWWDEATNSVCFFSDCCLENTINVSVTTACGTYSCEFTVNVQTNTAPLVVLPPDTAILQCQLEEICLPVGISDFDQNLMDIIVEGATYNDYSDQVCFTPDGSGMYTITVTATDSCGLATTDVVYVDVKLNEAPTISYEPVDSVSQCVLEEICLTVEISDIDGNLDTVIVSRGSYDSESGLVCFMPTEFGTSCISVVAVDTCGRKDSVQICIEVNQGDYVLIECPQDTLDLIQICAIGEVCVPLTITGDGFSVNASFGSWSDGNLCFTADTSGIYEITIIADAQCNSDTCVVVVPVEILEAVWVTCPAETNEFLCDVDTLCYALNVSSSVTSITASAPAYIDGQTVCVPLLQEGSFEITVVAEGLCGSDTCSFTINADFNAAPVLSAGLDTTFTECELSEICLDLSIEDDDNNITSVTTSLGQIVGDSTVCFTPDSYGVFQIIVTVTDSCGANDIDTVVVTYNEGEYASIFCPDDVQFASICGPSEVCVVAPVTPNDAQVTVLPAGTYDPETGTVCVFADTSGSYHITVIAEAQCSSDTCEFTLEVNMIQPPVVTCPSEIDTLLCLAQPDTLCIPVEVTGTGVEVNVNPIGYFSAGFVCLPLSEPGQYLIDIVAVNTCGADTCQMTVNVQADQEPVLTLPATLTFERCPNDTDMICIDGIYATDVESEPTITQVCGDGEFTAIRPDSGEVCFLPDSIGTYTFCFDVTDGCHVVTDSFTVDIILKADCDRCLLVSIDGGASTLVGRRKTVALNIESDDPVGGFDLLLSFDASVLSFQNATLADGVMEAWEYFRWNLGGGNCGSSCPSGVVRFVGIADQNNGAAHPPDSALHPNGPMLFIEFQVANDLNLGSQFIPINFVWFDCSDNTFSDPSGTLLYVDRRIYNVEGFLLWDEEDDINFPEESRPFGMGAPDECVVGTDKAQPVRCIDFINGGIKITPTDSIDARGDINLNGIAYEIADVVTFTNFFIRGLAAFTINVAGQVAATDVNADGLTLTVADLSFLIRIVIGDANPVGPKLDPYAERATVSSVSDQGILSIATETVGDIGAAYFVYDLDADIEIGQPRVTEAAQGLDLISHVENGQLKILLYDLGTGRIVSGANTIVEIPYSGQGSVRLTHVELVDYYSRQYKTTDLGDITPTSYALDQNYPNPFNPTTTISFTLPQATNWSLRIYNVTGALVREFERDDAAGTVEVVWDGRNESGLMTASGVYLYRLDAGTFNETRKMILLK